MDYSVAEYIGQLSSHIDLKSFVISTGQYMGLDARKPVFGGLGTTQAQTNLRIRAV